MNCQQAMHTKTNTNWNLKNLPPASMEQFCRALHPDLDLSPTCISWFRQATEHCTELILHRKRGYHFWATVKNFIFPDRQTGLVSQKIPISIHPNRLSVQDCHSLFLDIVNDYIVRAPRYSTEATMNMLLWQILYSLMGIMALGSLLVTTIFAYRRFGRSLEKPLDPLAAVFVPEKRARAVVNRNLRIAKYELQRLRVRHLVQPEEIFAPDGTATLVMKMSSKLSFLDGVVASQTNSTGRLYRMQELLGKSKPEYKTETIAKVMRFLNSYSRKLRVLLIFEEDPVYEQLLRKRKSTSPAKPPAVAHRAVGAAARAVSATRSLSPPKSNAPSPRAPTQIPRTFSRRTSSFSLRK